MHIPIAVIVEAEWIVGERMDKKKGHYRKGGLRIRDRLFQNVGFNACPKGAPGDEARVISRTPHCLRNCCAKLRRNQR